MTFAFPDYAPCSATHGLVQIVNKQHLKEAGLFSSDDLGLLL